MNRVKKSHLMYQHTPFSVCGRYVPENPGMIQVFSVDKTTCGHCKNKEGEYITVTLTAGDKPRLKDERPLN